MSTYLIDLQAACVRRGLSTKGTRRTLIARLKNLPAAPVYAINPAVPIFPWRTKELVSAIYYDIPKFNMRILLLGEYHEQPCSNVISSYVEDLRDSLDTRGECLDYYMEYRFEAIKPAGHTYIPSVAGGGGMLTGIREYLSGHLEPGLRTHFSDARSIVRSIPANILKLPFGFPLYKSIGSDMRDLVEHLTTVLVAAGGPVETLEALRFIRNKHLSYTPQELIAFYYGIGPHATRSGNPRRSLRERYKKDLDKIELALTAVLKYINDNANVHIDDMWVQYKLSFTMTLKELAVVRSRSRKTLKEFIRRHKHICPPKKLFKAMQATIVWASRTVGPGPRLSGWAIEAFADIYTFLRMFRFFDVSHPGGNNCEDIGHQRNVVYHSHVCHSINVALLIRLVFGIQPTTYFEALTCRGNGYASAYMNGFSNVVNGFDTRNYDNFDYNITTNKHGRDMPPDPQFFTELYVPPRTKFFQ